MTLPPRLPPSAWHGAGGGGRAPQARQDGWQTLGGARDAGGAEWSPTHPSVEEGGSKANETGNGSGSGLKAGSKAGSKV